MRATSLEIALLTGGQDRHYAVGLGLALVARDVAIDVIGSDRVDCPEFRGNPRVSFRNLHSNLAGAGMARKIGKVLVIYARLLHYAASAKPRIFHILWNNKLPILDRTLLTLFYKVAGKKIVLTAHNVNAGQRDQRDSWANRATLRIQYRLADHLFVHTKKMKDQLVDEFDVKASKVTVIPYGINNAVPLTEITKEEARRKLGLRNEEKVILYFGQIKRYKGLEYLVAAYQQIAQQEDYRLIIAGERQKGFEEYWGAIQQTIERDPCRETVLQRIEFIPDSETEIYFKSADVAVLPYTDIFQSGILFLAYAYGLPVIATDVGSFREDVIEGTTGFICPPRDSESLAAALKHYFESELFRELKDRRSRIRNYAVTEHSWSVVGKMTRDVYESLLYRDSGLREPDAR